MFVENIVALLDTERPANYGS